MTFKKLSAAIAMLKALVFLSIQGRRMLTTIKKDCFDNQEDRWPAPCRCLGPKAMKRDLTRMYASIGMMK